MKFKVGDKVRILDGSNITDYEYGWVPSMKNHIGEIHKIKEFDGYSARLKGVCYAWDVRGLEKVDKQNYTIVIYRNDREVIALDKSTGKKAVAKCSPDDEFDFHVGASLAVNRLFCKEVCTRVEEKPKLDMYNADGKIFSNIEQMAKDFANFKNKPISELFGYQEEPKLYNGKVVCVNPISEHLTKGKVYEFVDGFSRLDDGITFPRGDKPIKSYEDIEYGLVSKFIELSEDK